MNKEEAKKLRYGDKITIRVPSLYNEEPVILRGTVRMVGREYVHYEPCGYAPPFQRAKFDVVERDQE